MNVPLPPQLARPHLIGIGGAGMSGVARIVLARGGAVSGSDAKDSRALLALRTLGAKVAVGHSAVNLDQLDAEPTVVISTKAVHQTDPYNPELVEAARRGIPVIHRSAALAALMTGYQVAAVTGTAGKTSTTSMLTVALQHCGADPSFLIGGDLNVSGSGAHHGNGELFVAEADESDGSFLAYSPDIAVVTNVQADHLDHHGTFAAYTASFDAFVTRLRPGGVLIANADDPGSAALAARAGAAGVRVRRYGRAATAAEDARLGRYTPVGGRGVAPVALTGPEGTVQRVQLEIAVPGEHMASNALAVLLAGLELGAPLPGLLAGLAGFGGVRRRFEFKGRAAGVRVYDDYAHHPIKVAAALRGARQVAGPGRLLVAFQPHLYSRTRDFAAEFGRALALADVVLLLDVYGAREDPLPGVTGALIAAAVPLPADQVHYEPSWGSVPARLAELARPGDLVITMGAGDVTVLGPELISELERRTTKGPR
ncbi:MAG TPA: UDP-N-acetylmuramate--L-alanine ligase [Pseudonocardiaceae bacterium]|jgi:UDP-N-acetylmuramate--alanine ligase|nr:UDP-N-acetylmuramate--L-alanine ligase [Pseudonocardiaceae bacterium]